MAATNNAYELTLCPHFISGSVAWSTGQLENTNTVTFEKFFFYLAFFPSCPTMTIML